MTPADAKTYLERYQPTQVCNHTDIPSLCHRSPPQINDYACPAPTLDSYKQFGVAGGAGGRRALPNIPAHTKSFEEKLEVRTSPAASAIIFHSSMYYVAIERHGMHRPEEGNPSVRGCKWRSQHCCYNFVSEDDERLKWLEGCPGFFTLGCKQGHVMLLLPLKYLCTNLYSLLLYVDNVHRNSGRGEPGGGVTVLLGFPMPWLV